jgi:hypothetical protein
MKKYSITGIVLSSLLVSFATIAETPNQTILPDDMKVYYNSKQGLTLKSVSGSAEKNIPTSNEFKDMPGCYLACISKTAKHGIFPIGENAYLTGQIRVKGRYMDGYCVPTGYENKDARTSKEFKDKCQEAFPERCGDGSCFVGNNTSAWF